jgi:FkbM family methyltransferase
VEFARVYRQRNNSKMPVLFGTRLTIEYGPMCETGILSRRLTLGGGKRAMASFSRKLTNLSRVLKEGGVAGAWSFVTRRMGQRSREMPGGLVRLDGCVFRCPDNETRDLIVDGIYEGPERFAIKRFMRRDVPVVEFGGSIGVVACVANRRLRNPGKHVVVEADPGLIPMLKENRDRNRSAFEIIHAAAGARDATVRIHLGGGALNASLIRVSDNYQDVPGIKLAAILQERGFDRCVVVSDIEGAESLLIRDEIATFQAKVETLIVEFHPAISGPDDVLASHRLLAEHGFQELWADHDTVVFKNSALS